MNRILGIDYGERRVGLALSDPLKIFAKPLITIDRKVTQNYIDEIYKVINKHLVSEVVIGIPLNMKGKDSKQTIIVREFAKELESLISLPIQLLDERLSSKSAKQSLILQNKSPSKYKDSIDSIAACLILQEFLDSKS